jgi:hypothetical protein
MGLYGLDEKITEPMNAPQEISEMAEMIRKTHHEHLEDAKIAYVVVPGSPKSKGKTVLGKCRGITGVMTLVTDADFIIQVPWGQWQKLSDSQREAVLDHELAHCGADVDEKTGDTFYRILPHDVEEFSAIIDRHGLYMPDRVEFAATCARAHQALLFSVEPKAPKKKQAEG